MARNMENDDDSDTLSLEDLPEEDHAELEARVKELRDHILRRYVKVGDTFVKHDARSVIVATPIKRSYAWSKSKDKDKSKDNLEKNADERSFGKR
ncbi:hypothetical protein GUJ93_ZPchr0010g9365 [Zizania palustris]|uniref:Uncharacterized protein n=1 Tax=Zizania palustris TaxID=103762 RepID=A0A8J5WEC1_ZIZPA|nr:hypothetical protein GUJ93_ZPchr0010g9365 [Zizania palustris]